MLNFCVQTNIWFGHTVTLKLLQKHVIIAKLLDRTQMTKNFLVKPHKNSISPISVQNWILSTAYKNMMKNIYIHIDVCVQTIQMTERKTVNIWKDSHGELSFLQGLLSMNKRQLIAMLIQYYKKNEGIMTNLTPKDTEIQLKVTSNLMKKYE